MFVRVLPLVNDRGVGDDISLMFDERFLTSPTHEVAIRQLPLANMGKLGML